MSETAEIAYKCSEIYYPEDEKGIKWDSPDISIDWPCKNPILSEKDAALQIFKEKE
jgi:dTDP-4-dehydrorhamnose 3,5-epimerase